VTLVLAHAARTLPAVSDLPLEDDHLLEYDASGKLLWEWFAGDHIDELGLSPAARAAIKSRRCRRRPDAEARVRLGACELRHLHGREPLVRGRRQAL
jgi:hypothetical protein